MPIYTYRCENCGIQFDRRQHFDDAPLTICPECEAEALRKVYLPVGIVFKGSGFYATDNKSPSGLESTRVSNNGSGEDKKAEKSPPDGTKKDSTSSDD
jgi:putative FmdB family regulatory protein